MEEPVKEEVPMLSQKSNSGDTSFFVDTNYYGRAETVKVAFDTRMTILRLLKHGTKDIYRLQHTNLLESFEPIEESSLQKLRKEPLVYGN